MAEKDLTQKQRDDLAEVVLHYNAYFRELTSRLSLDETIFFLKCLRTGIEGAEHVFRSQTDHPWDLEKENNATN